MQKPLVTVVFPNYNELKNLERGVLTTVQKYLSAQTYTWEVIISDDGSTDKSPEFLDKFIQDNPGFRLVKNDHAGKPFALKSGIKEAKGQYILLADMDLSTPISELAKLLPFTKDYAVVIGSRGARRTDSALYRQLASVLFLYARRSILLPEIKDTQCGFKLFEATLIKDIFPKMRILARAGSGGGWKVTAYDVELLHLAKKHGASIKEVRVDWKDEDTSVGKSRNFFKESVEMLFEILRVRINDMLGKYSYRV